MPPVTTIKLTSATHVELKAVADRDGLTLDGAVQKLLRADRQRLIGIELANRPTTEADSAWVRSSSAAVSRAIG